MKYKSCLCFTYLADEALDLFQKNIIGVSQN